MKKQALANIAQVWRKKQLIKQEVDSVLGKYNLSSTAKDIYVYATATKVCIAHIIQNSYFQDKSFSTIKRAVIELKSCGLIKSVTDTQDKRIAWLTPVDEG